MTNIKKLRFILTSIPACVRNHCAVFTVLMLLFTLVDTSFCCAESFILPAGMLYVEDAAFESCSSFTEVIIPDGTLSIGESVFYGCNCLQKVTLPSSIECIGDHAFDACGEALYVIAPKNSFASDWVKTSGFDWNSDSVCRALSIGINYTGTDYVLYAPTNDMHAVAFCLRQMQTTKYSVSEKANLTCNELVQTIASTFSSATEDDISFFYFSGHGDTDGALIGSDLSTLSPSKLKNCLDGIRGRKVIIVDTCYSGALLDAIVNSSGSQKSRMTAQNSSREAASSFVSSFVSAFSAKKRTSTASASYYVMASCRSDEEAEEGYVISNNSGKYMGFFTYALCVGCGWNGILNRSVEPAADTNDDGVITFNEAFSYAYNWALIKNPNQHAVVSPSGCTSFSPFRH